ncbi:MAG: sulfur carrier protein ThiS [Pseudomonadota bacterium]
MVLFGGFMEISLNGKKIISNSTTLLRLISETGFDTQSLIAEVNFEVIKEENWSDTTIKDGDQIELLSFVGGG